MKLRAAAAAGLALHLLASLPSVAAEPMETYVVRQGDTLYELGRRYFAGPQDYRTVARLNRISDPRRLQAGAKLKVPVRLLRVTPVEARVAGYKGLVTATVAGRTVALTRGAMLAEGAVISTGPNAFVRLDLPDGSHMAIPSQSQVRLSQMRAVELTGVVRRELEVRRGRLESDVTPLQDPRDSYTVRTPMSVSAVRGTEFAVSYDAAANRANTEVIEGLVNVSHGEQSASIAARHGAVSQASGVIGPLPLTPAPKLANPGKVQDEASVRFAVVEPQDGRYQVRLANDAGFIDVVEETEAASGEIGFGALPDGVYFLRLAVVDTSGLVGVPATYAFERRLNTLTLSSPAASREEGLRRYKFRWNAGGAGERTYRLQLFLEGREAPVIDEGGLTMQELTVTDLPPGVYHWRVMSRTYARGSYAEKWSPPERFEVGR